MLEVLKYFPKIIQIKIQDMIKAKEEFVEEIRIRVNKFIIVKLNEEEIIINHVVSIEEILECMQKICENSIYTYQNEIAEGFITVKGGHRVGIVGSCVVENGKVINIKYINSLNFRIARQILGCSNEIINHIVKINENSIYNCLIVAPPCSGKTTILRDIVRQLSSGVQYLKLEAINVGIVDERGEIAALYKGVPQNDIGLKSDIIENVHKSVGIKMLVRSMAPQVIVADEIGNESDIDAINYAMCSGCKGIFTAHGSEMNDILLNPILEKLVNIHIFEKIIFLDKKEKGRMTEIYELNDQKYVMKFK